MILRRIGLFFILFSCRATFAFAQAPSDNTEKYQLHIKKTDQPIQLDGVLDEAAWQQAQVAEDFFQGFPYDTSFALSKTRARLTFDDNYLYVAAECYQTKEYIVFSLRRDFRGGTTGIFGLNLDPFRDKLNGFNFALSPLNVQRESLVTNGSDLATQWDNKWYSAVKNHDDRWVLEMAIPFSTLRYKKDRREWNINFTRFDRVRNERSNWAPIPRNFGGNNLTFSGTLIWDDPPPRPGANISLIPYISGRADRDYINDDQWELDGNVGFDAKIGVTSSLNLDITVNPDFSQVEVDRQIINLSRFEQNFPERRQFFLENQDLFSNFGNGNINPFFSRRIGIIKDQDTQENVIVPITAGARLSGRLNRNWRVGLLNIMTGKKENINLPRINYTVAALQRRFMQRSNVGLIFVNQQNIQADSTADEFPFDGTTYNRVLGMDINLASNDGKWDSKFFYHHSFTPEKSSERGAGAMNLNFNTQTWEFESNLQYVGRNYDAKVGLVPRTGIVRSNGQVFYKFYPNSNWINTVSIGPDYDMIYGQEDRRILDWDAGVFFNVRFQNSARFRMFLLRFEYVYLFDEFDPTGSDGLPLPANTSYRVFRPFIGYTSNSRKDFFYEITGRVGSYFNGRMISVNSNWNLRFQPYAVLSLDLNFTRINLPDPYPESTLYAIGPRLDVSFSRNVFLTSFFQYNNQINNINVNLRFQWRFKPVSDLFIVYTDNYFAQNGQFEFDDNAFRDVNPFQVKNRALVFKLTYWINL